MALLGRIYFNAVFGALGGLLGWMLFGVFGDKNVPDSDRFLFSPVFWQLLSGGALIGGSIGYFVVSVEALRDRSLLRFVRLAAYGVVLGMIGGAAGILIGEGVNYLLVGWIGASRDRPVLHLLGAMLARGLGWMFLGVAVGFSEGIAARSLGKFSYGTLGGAVGGFVGGTLFGLALEKSNASGGHASLWGAIGLIILGACIGSLSALVKSVFQPASVKVLRGWQEGREYPLDKMDNLLGRDEHADIALFRDMKVEKKHAVIQRAGERFLLHNNNAPSEWTRVNDRPVFQSCDLQDGDRIQLGNILLRFQARAAVHRKRKGRG
ncbi:MAG TPA: FHA domain-containing protein [Gemmataceae bacterium]|nr:FHA domain-containing protein [Gemmataceae bacterium]